MKSGREVRGVRRRHVCGAVSTPRKKDSMKQFFPSVSPPHIFFFFLLYIYLHRRRRTLFEKHVRILPKRYRKRKRFKELKQQQPPGKKKKKMTGYANVNFEFFF